jgi:putative phage-type endonuclease
MITESQRQQRHKFIGGSDAAAAIGINPYKTPVDLYFEKIGQAEPFNGNERTYWGNVLEQPVANRLAEETGFKLRRHGQTLIAANHPFMGCHLDFKVTGQPIVVEIKTGGFFTRKDWGPSGSDEIPDQYLVQIHHQMICAGYDKALVGVLLGGQEFRHYEIGFDKDLAQIIVEKETEFWQHVTTRTPPPATTLGDIASLYPFDTGSSIEATAEILEIVEQLKAAKTEAAAHKGKVDALELALKTYMADNSTLIGPDGKPIATWKTQTTNRIDAAALKTDAPEIAAKFTKATENRVLRVK